MSPGKLLSWIRIPRRWPVGLWLCRKHLWFHGRFPWNGWSIFERNCLSLILHYDLHDWLRNCHWTEIMKSRNVSVLLRSLVSSHCHIGRWCCILFRIQALWYCNSLLADCVWLISKWLPESGTLAKGNFSLFSYAFLYFDEKLFLFIERINVQPIFLVRWWLKWYLPIVLLLTFGQSRSRIGYQRSARWATWQMKQVRWYK